MRAFLRITALLIVACPLSIDPVQGQAVGLDQIAEMIQRGQYRSAEPLLNRLVTQQENGRAYFLLGFIQIQTFRYQEAEVSLRRATQLEPQQPDWLLALAKSLLEQGKNRGAVQVLDRALALSHSPELLIARAMCRLNLGQPDDAETDLTDALRLQQDNAEIHFKLAQIYLNRGDYEKASRRIESALQFNPQSLEARYLLGLSHRRRGNLEQARDAFQQVLAATPGHVGALYNLGQTLALLGDAQGARSKLELFRQTSRHQDQIEFHRNGVKKNPDNRPGRIQLARLLLEAGYNQEALEHLMIAQRLDQANPETYELLTTTFHRLARPQEADWASRLARELAQPSLVPRN